MPNPIDPRTGRPLTLSAPQQVFAPMASHVPPPPPTYDPIAVANFDLAAQQGVVPLADRIGKAWVEHGPSTVKQGLANIWDGQFTRGARQTLAGIGVTAAPMAAPALIGALTTAPVSTLATAAGSAALGGVAHQGAQRAGFGPDASQLIGELAAVPGGVAGYALGQPATLRRLATDVAGTYDPSAFAKMTHGLRGLGRLRSRLATDVIPNLSPAPQHPNRVRAVLARASRDEIKESGIEDFLTSRGQTPVTQEDVVRYLSTQGRAPEAMLGEKLLVFRSDRANFPTHESVIGDPKYSKYSMPGYRANDHERLITLPTQHPASGYFEPHYGKETADSVLAHYRANDRTIVPAGAANGEPALFIEEGQSTWHETAAKGRKIADRLGVKATREFGYQQKGYEQRLSNAIRARDDAWDEARVTNRTSTADPTKADEAYKKAETLDRAVVALRSGQTVPDAPYKGTGWQELLLKRALIDAVERGKVRLGWPTGRQQAERYGKDEGSKGMEAQYDTNWVNIMNALEKKYGDGNVVGKAGIETGLGPRVTESVWSVSISPKLRQHILDKGLPLTGVALMASHDKD